MSLKAFHLVFIVLSILLCVTCAVWAHVNHAGQAFEFGAILAGVILLIYGVWFVKKARKIIT